MCGIAGFTRFNNAYEGQSTLEKMGGSIRHRGPDAGGFYVSEQVGLCHRRLSIIDLSEDGNQPMYSTDKNLVIVFNGEIYNFQALRKDMQDQGYHFNSHSDTEVILALFQTYGYDCVEKLNGMFAFAIWDHAKKELFFARDRIGKKPLYYFFDGKDIVFASEIKAILEAGNVPKNIRLDALYDFFTYQYVPDPKTIFKDVHKLKPGHWMTVSEQGIHIQSYWDISFSQTMTQSKQDIAEQLLSKLRVSTQQRMISDVPLGAFLSGGVDSSAVVALMAEKSPEPVTTCSIGFDSKKYDEVQYARQVAEQYATQHYELTVKENVAAHIEEIVAFFDEPFADPSLIPTYFVSKLARQKVTVAVAGDGGDENFAGYEKYSIDHFENRLRRLFPSFVRQSLFRPLAHLVSGQNNVVLRKASTLLHSLSQTPEHGFFMSNAFCTDQLWQSLAKHNLKQALDDYHPSSITESYYHQADTDDHLSRILYTDIKTYLPGDILVKVDRMSMANSLEVRAPILDYQLMEFAANIPSSLKFHKGEKKYILKECIKSKLPDDILYRKKMGFSTPLADWFRNEIRAFAQDKLFSADNGLAQYFDMQVLKDIWHKHQSGVRDYSTILWSSLMFELWFQRYMQ